MATKHTGHPLLGLLVICGSVGLAVVLEGGHLAWLLQPSACLFVSGGVLGAVLIGCGLMAPLTELGDLLRGRAGDYVLLRRALHLAIQAGALSGVIGTIIGLIHVMTALSDPTKIGAGLAVAMTALLYGLLYALLGYGLDALASRRAEASEGDSTPSEGASGSPVIGTLVIFLAFVGVHIMEGGHMGTLISGSGALLVGGGVLGALLMSTGVIGPMKQLAAVLSGGEVDDGRSLLDAVRLVILSAPVAGLVGATVGIVHVLVNLSDPSKLGAGVAVAYLAMLYGGLIALFAYAAAALVATRGGGEVKLPSLGHAPLYAAAGFALAFGIMMTTLYALAIADLA
jgi:flagellar motor component MotA